MWECELDSVGLGQDTVLGICEHDNELLGYIKGEHFSCSIIILVSCNRHWSSW